MNYFIIFFIITNNVIFLIYIFVYNKHNSIKSSQSNILIEDNLYPRLWSCKYKEENNIHKMSFHSQLGEDRLFYNKYFKNKLNGIYIELGALDGLQFSNTYFFENFLGWSGILIEGGYENCMNLIKNQNKRPRSQIICSAICKNKYVEFKTEGAVGGINGELPANWFGLDKKKSIAVRCSNISNILHIHKITHIDLFSLDVEGSELNVLETFDFSIFVHYWTIEFNSDKDYKNKMVRKLLLDHGYKQCELKLSHNNECWEDINYDSKVKELIEKEEQYRSNFSVKC